MATRTKKKTQKRSATRKTKPKKKAQKRSVPRKAKPKKKAQKRSVVRKARPKKRARVHRVRASVTVPELTKAGSSIRLQIFNADGTLGTLVLGRGSLTWFSRSAKNGTKRSWTTFADWMNDD